MLARFRAEEKWVPEPGDLLYLPPDEAHWGIAEGPCFTYSIGFLSSSRRDLVQSFLDYLSHELGARVPDELLEDPGSPRPAPLEPASSHLATMSWVERSTASTRAPADRALGDHA